jgi:hypothetical protein
MSPLTILASLIALLVAGWALWFVIEFIRYILSGEYEMDKRLREIVR